jgi:molecular chaperone Hsp33
MTEQDILRRFIFEQQGIRGVWVKLSQSWQQAKAHQSSIKIVRQQLGEALVAVVMLSAIIKFKGSMILQAQGDGAIKTLVVQSDDQRKIRGLIRSEDHVIEGCLETMFGQGNLVLTINTEASIPYQGIVPLQGNNLAEALESYFDKSEQLKTRLWLFASETSAAGLLIQELPPENVQHQDWQTIEILANTVTEKEMLELDCEQLLHRLFHEQQLRLFAAENVAFQCACSRARIERTLVALGRIELEGVLLERGQIEVICEFCNQHYVFDRPEIEIILLNADTDADKSATRH